MSSEKIYVGKVKGGFPKKAKSMAGRKTKNFEEIPKALDESKDLPLYRKLKAPS